VPGVAKLGFNLKFPIFAVSNKFQVKDKIETKIKIGDLLQGPKYTK